MSNNPSPAPKFWRTKPLSELNRQEWESLCDGCGLCCLIKCAQPGGRIRFTGIACRHLDISTCRCRIYERRQLEMDSCMRLSADNLNNYLAYLPETCAYRRLAEGLDLYEWHPLISGSPESVHTTGTSVRDRVLSAEDFDETELECMLAGDDEL